MCRVHGENELDPGKNHRRRARPLWIDGKALLPVKTSRRAASRVTGCATFFASTRPKANHSKASAGGGLIPCININKVWLLYYVNPNEGTAKRNEEYAAKHSEAQINTQSGTVWFDDVVGATKYIGPITPK